MDCSRLQRMVRLSSRRAKRDEKEAYRASASRKTVLYMASASFDLASSWKEGVILEFNIL